MTGLLRWFERYLSVYLRGLSSALLLSQTRFARILLLDCVTVTARPLDLCHALVALVGTLDAMAVPIVPLDHRQAVRPFVSLFDRVAI